MNDVFNEQLVAKKSTPKDLMIRIGIALGGVALIAIALTVKVLLTFMVPIVIVIIFIELVLIRSLNVEFEYIFTNGELDIDKITNKSRRKQVLSVNVRSFITMVPLKGKAFEGEISQYSQVMDFSSGVVTENTYAALVDINNKRVKLIIEPNEQMFKAIRTYIPRIVKK